MMAVILQDYLLLGANLPCRFFHNFDVVSVEIGSEIQPCSSPHIILTRKAVSTEIGDRNEASDIHILIRPGRRF